MCFTGEPNKKKINDNDRNQKKKMMRGVPEDFDHMQALHFQYDAAQGLRAVSPGNQGNVQDMVEAVLMDLSNDFDCHMQPYDCVRLRDFGEGGRRACQISGDADPCTLPSSSEDIYVTSHARKEIWIGMAAFSFQP